MGTEQDEALDVLRAVWRARGQQSADLADELGEARSCKRMTDVGFEEFAGADETERAEAWRARLQREGKLRPTGSVGDLVRDPAATR
jgi:hypothetical protein